MIYNLVLLFLLTYNINLFSVSFDVASPYLHKPSGMYKVGRKEIHLINQKACPNVFFNAKNANDFSTNNLEHCNEIELSIYYPTLEQGSSAYRPILSLISDLKSFGNEPSDSQIKEIRSIRSYSINHALPLNDKFPVIFFSPGYGLSSQEYENIITELTSHGYIVIGINSQFINGELSFNDTSVSKVVEPETEEDKKNLFRNSYSDLDYVYTILKNNRINDKILNMIDWDKVGLLGHSLGSVIVARFSYHKGICAVVALDLTIDLLEGNNCHTDLKTPLLHMFSTQLYAQNENKEFPYLCKDNNTANYKRIAIVGDYKDNDYSMHMNFCDYSTLQYVPSIYQALAQLNQNNPEGVFLGHGDGNTITDIINKNIYDFYTEQMTRCDAYKK